MVDRGTASSAVLAASIAAAAALGVPGDGILQDTFKSAVLVIGVLASALVFVVPRTGQALAVRWHPVLFLPLLLAAYAIGSMAWAQAWPAGVEAVRWLSIALVVAVAMQIGHDAKWQAILAWGIVAGATIASAWVLLQFFFGLELFPQGPRPASTFVNRNFFAEFAVCALPFFAVLVARERRGSQQLVLAVAAGFVATAIFMTGSRAALIALGVLLPIGLAVAANHRWIGIALVTFIVLGFVPTGDEKIAAEGRGDTAISRAVTRAEAIASRDEATTMRLDMWSSTARMIADHPVAGVGAGAWEHEADFYAHNEFLQVVAEYGLAGWIFIAALAVWMLRAMRNPDTWRGGVMCSLLALLIVSNLGFPWHLAMTAAMSGLCIGSLAARDAREVVVARRSSLALTVAFIAALALAGYATSVATRAESRLTRAASIALSIGATSNPSDPRWAASRSEMLRLVDEGLRLHPDDRQLAPLVADELGRWGDWPNAIRIWEYVLRAHPNRVVVLTNVARGYAAIGRPDLAMAYFDRARRLQPDAASVRAVEKLLRQMSSSKG